MKKLFISQPMRDKTDEEILAVREKAIKSAPNAKWKVVAFHHDIYGSGQPPSDFDGANLRTIFAVIFLCCHIAINFTINNNLGSFIACGL